MTTESLSPALVPYETALAGMKSPLRKKYTRDGWNGKGLYIQMHGSVRASDVKLSDGLTPYIEPFFVIVNTVTGKVNTWVPSVSDQFGEDYREYLD